MKTAATERYRTVHVMVYTVQALLYIGAEPEWADVRTSYFKRGDEYFKWTTLGRTLLETDQPPRYYGDRFWGDLPAFTSLAAAEAFRKEVIAGDWAPSKVRTVLQVRFESVLQIYPADDVRASANA